MDTTRKQKREWAVYDQQMNQFYNMDCKSIVDDQYFKDIPSLGFTYEEAERFIVHCDNKRFCKIINIKQPKYLLEFELMAHRKEQSFTNAKEMSKASIITHEIQTKNIAKNNNKQRYIRALTRFKAECLKPMDGIEANELKKQEPTLDFFNLSPADFSTIEKNQLKSNYGVVL